MIVDSRALRDIAEVSHTSAFHHMPLAKQSCQDFYWSVAWHG